MKNRLLSTLLVLIMLLGLLPSGMLTASADEEDPTFDLLNGQVTLTYTVDELSDPSKACATIKKCKINDGATGLVLEIPVQVPGIVSGPTITAIAADAFIECAGLVSITIPKSVTDIGSEAFRDCENLESITILPDDTYKTNDEVMAALADAKNDGLTARIGATAFLRCKALETINIPARVVEIGQNAFRGCAGLTSVRIWNPEIQLGDYDNGTNSNFDIFGGKTNPAAFEGKKLCIYCQRSYDSAHPASNAEKYYFEGHEGWIWANDIFGRSLSFTVVYPEPDVYNEAEIGDWAQVYWLGDEPGVTINWYHAATAGNEADHFVPNHGGSGDAVTDPHWVEGADYDSCYTVEFTLNPDTVANWYDLPDDGAEPAYAYKEFPNHPNVTYSKRDNTGTLTFGTGDDQYTDRPIIVLKAKDTAALAGTVTDSNNQPIAAATISLVEATVDDDGTIISDGDTLAVIPVSPDPETGRFTAEADIGSIANMTGASGRYFKVVASAEGYRDADIYYDFDDTVQRGVPFSMNLGRVPYESDLQISLKDEDSYGIALAPEANGGDPKTYKVTITAYKNGYEAEDGDGAIYYQLLADEAAAKDLPGKGDAFDNNGWSSYTGTPPTALDPAEANYVYAVFVVDGTVAANNGTYLIPPEDGPGTGDPTATITLTVTGGDCGSATIGNLTVPAGGENKVDVPTGEVTLGINKTAGHEACGVEVKLGEQKIEAADGVYKLTVDESAVVTVTFRHAGSGEKPGTITYTVKYVLGKGGKYNGATAIADDVFHDQPAGEAVTLQLTGIAPDGELTNDDTALVSAGWLVDPSALYIDKAVHQEDGEEVSRYVIEIPADAYTVDTAITLTAQWEMKSHVHSWDTVESVPAKCTENGYTTYKCAQCGETKTEIKFAGGHTESGWSVTKEPTCTATGLRIKTCTVCEKTVASETVPALGGGHDYREASRDTKPGTACGEITVLHLECTKCKDTYDKTLEGTNHKGVKAYGSVAPTCFKDGLTGGRYCTVCGEVIEPRTVVPAGHKKVTETTAADCTTPAYSITSCSVCKTVLEKEKTGDALGHDFDTAGKPDGKGAIIHACGKCDAQWAETKIELDNVAKDDGITVSSGGAGDITVTLDKAVVDGLKEKLEESAGKSMTFVIETIDTETQLEEAYAQEGGLKAAVRGHAAKKDSKVVHITLKDNDGAPLLPDTDSGMGDITVKIPYTKRYDTSGEISVYYVDAEGNFQKYDTGKYENGFVTFTTRHFSTFVVNEVCLHKDVPYETVYAATADRAGLKQGVCSDCFEILAVEIPASAAVTPTDIKLDNSTLRLSVGGTAALKATVTPEGADVTWESDNAGVATVDAAGRVTAISKGTATITARAGDITATCTVTVTGSSGGTDDPGSTNPPAVPGGNGAGSSTGGSGGSSGNSSVSSPSTDAASGSTTVNVSTGSTTAGATAKAAVSAANMDKAVGSAVTEAAKQGTAPVVQVKVTVSEKADSLNVTLPVSSLETLAGTANSSLVVTSSVAEVALDHAALSALAGQATGSTVVLEISPVAASSLSAAQRQAVGTAPVMDLSLVSRGVAIHDYNSGKITVTLPYELAGGQSAGDVAVYRLEDNGSLTPCETSYSDGKVTFTTTHLSKYVIGSKEMAGQVREIAFTDVSETDYYYDAVVWGVANGITFGVSETAFGPGQACTRAQIVSFLWRHAGSPEMSGANPFTDVSETDDYYDAVLWAVANGVTYGTTPTTFSPDQTCTRAQAVSFLYRCKGSPAVSGGNSFTDVSESDYYYNAVRWAVERGVTYGTTPTTFGPGQDCTRAQIMSFMYRADG